MITSLIEFVIYVTLICFGVWLFFKFGSWRYFNQYDGSYHTVKLTLKQVEDFFKINHHRWEGNSESLRYTDKDGKHYFIKLSFRDFVKYRRLLKQYGKVKANEKIDNDTVALLDSVQWDIDRIRAKSEKQIRDSILKTKKIIERELKNDSTGASSGTLPGSTLPL